MKSISVTALILSVIAIAISGFIQFNQINKLQLRQEQLSKDVLKLNQVMAKAWQPTEETKKPEWPKYHETTGVLKFITENRVIIDQEEMPGFMRAMIMSYEVENQYQLKNLEENDLVNIKLKETENSLTVVDIVKR